MKPLSRALLLFRVVFYSALLAGCALAFAPAGTALHSHFNDKLLHAVGFFLMALLAHLAHPKARQAIPITGLILFGLFIELVQAYLPYRSFSVLDWLADIAGIALYHLALRSLITMVFSRYRYGPG